MTIDANALRLLAETADGLRNQDLVLITRDDVLMVVPANEVLGADTQLTTLRTDDDVERDYRPTFEIQVQINGAGHRLDSDFDAVFWSLAAVDKFLIPYYTRLWPADTITAFRAKLESDSAWVALPHPPGSKLKVDRFTDIAGFQRLTLEEYLELDISGEQEQQQ
jgi:hypothetical protein